jgi:hypothetical protein
MRVGTPGEWRQLRYLAKELLGMYLSSPVRRRGRPACDDDNNMLPMLEVFLRVAQRDRGMTRDAALRWFVKSCETKEGKQLLGASTDAAIRRLRKKLKDGGFAKRKPTWLKKLRPGLTLSKLRLGVFRE